MQDAIVTDRNGHRVEVVRARPGTGADGGQTDEITGYALGEGEKVIYEGFGEAMAMYAPRWDGERWVETKPRPTEGDDPATEYPEWDSAANEWAIKPIPPPPEQPEAPGGVPPEFGAKVNIMFAMAEGDIAEALGADDIIAHEMAFPEWGGEPA